MYSTCTFATVENEETCSEFVKRHPDMEVIEMHRLMPHKIKGEGHFSALMHKVGNADSNNRKYPEIKASKKDAVESYRKFEKENLKVVLEGQFVSYGECLYLLPKEMISLDKIKCIRPGLFLGEVKKGRFEPSHHLCMTLRCEDFVRTISLDDEEILLYLKGETIKKESEKGFGAMLYKEKYPVIQSI